MKVTNIKFFFKFRPVGVDFFQANRLTLLPVTGIIVYRKFCPTQIRLIKDKH
jgi:hypothetical protein